MAGVIIIGVLDALVLAVGLSIVDTVRRSARPHDAVLGWVPRLGRYADVSLHPSARTTPGIVVYRLDDRIFFANARYFRARVQEAVRGAPQPVYWLVFDAEAVTHADSTASRRSSNCSPTSSGTTSASQLRACAPTMRRLETIGLAEEIGAERFYPSVSSAVEGCVRELSIASDLLDEDS
jgi:MFS superfamily sulfate permease-like transporter